MPDRNRFSSQMTLPVICAPMFLVTTPAMVSAACLSGVMGVLPRGNFRSVEAFEAALATVRATLDAHRKRHPQAEIGPLAVNLAARATDDEMSAVLAACRRHGVELLITALGDPAEVVRRAKDWGAAVYHDVTTIRFAEKAIASGVDGLIAVGWGGGGHSGLLSPLVMIPQLRRLFDGAIVMAGGVTTGEAVRAAEILGADLAYVGTRFIATQESGASDAYKAMLIDARDGDLLYTDAVNGVSASWLKASLRDQGLDPANLGPRPAVHSHDHLPDGVRPWRDLWSAGQGAALIDDIPGVAELVERLRQEYAAARATP